jgi:hypothetical protein
MSPEGFRVALNEERNGRFEKVRASQSGAARKEDREDDIMNSADYTTILTPEHQGPKFTDVEEASLRESRRIINAAIRQSRKGSPVVIDAPADLCIVAGVFELWTLLVLELQQAGWSVKSRNGERGAFIGVELRPVAK